MHEEQPIWRMLLPLIITVIIVEVILVWGFNYL